MSTSFGWEGKGGMVHSDSGCTRGVQVKLWDPLRTRAIPERLRGVITTRRYTNPRLPLPLPTPSHYPRTCYNYKVGLGLASVLGVVIVCADVGTGEQWLRSWTYHHHLVTCSKHFTDITPAAVCSYCRRTQAIDNQLLRSITRLVAHIRTFVGGDECKIDTFIFDDYTVGQLIFEVSLSFRNYSNTTSIRAYIIQPHTIFCNIITMRRLNWRLYIQI